ncbi:SAM-dependent methyltransferase [Rhizobium rhizosphaerae]|uniref:SAM-dependent methyltransferase n=1 Tax=Xaviernesmea rhizosphaerae TaxID=1672749 RepID=A0ABX3PG17_9HYPH|nr:class I SAM-dependent methyltransferase [Xaviernesmea rhizosphaerae]OQP87455.1 SAM-dependent methyltransferase [Xaviernesmea rhizosphaerae]
MADHASRYDHWAWLYNQTLGPRYGAHKIGPIERVVLPHVPAGGAILDLCCGTGQLAAALQARQFHVTGLDGSADMLRHARDNAPSARFVQGDARHFDLETPFDAVLCTSASLNHMEGPEDLAAVFSSVNRALKAGGIFVFDVNHPAQMARHWHGRPSEGEMQPDFAWAITPQYDPAAGQGAFTVDIFRRANGQRRSRLRALAERLTRARPLRRLRLALLARPGLLHRGWEHNRVVNRVWGHDLDQVSALLAQNGFAPELRSTTGGPVDDGHAAYFFCRKIAETGAQPGNVLAEVSA